MFHNLGKKIRNLRLTRNISISEFAYELGVSGSYLSNLETGKTDSIKIETLEVLYRKFGMFKESSETNFSNERMVCCFNLLDELKKEKPAAVDYYLELIEKGVKLHKSNI
jgi:transcriptional regulator with XRE-family HTH domain